MHCQESLLIEHKTFSSQNNLTIKAIAFANNEASHVIVLSIPDWGITPFAEGRNRSQIAKEIDDFNAINKQIAQRYQAHYIDITPGSRKAVESNASLLLELATRFAPGLMNFDKWPM